MINHRNSDSRAPGRKNPVGRPPIPDSLEEPSDEESVSGSHADRIYTLYSLRFKLTMSPFAETSAAGRVCGFRRGPIGTGKESN